MRRFTKCDWMSFAGAEKFSDGNEPLIEEYGGMVAIVDKYGLQIEVPEHEDATLMINSDDVDYCKDIVEKVMKDLKGCTPDQMAKYLKAMK